MTKQTGNGKVYLVGAGPGDAGLLSLRGAALLSHADCVVYDKLVNPLILDHAHPKAEIVYTPKRVQQAGVSQDVINELLVVRAKAGQTVVRLKGGDPCMFGRGWEEVKILDAAGIDYEIVPGVTAGIAAGAYAGVMLTERDLSSQVVFVTGHEADGKTESAIDWNLLAKFRGTIVLYMAMSELPGIVEKLQAGGKDASTAAAVVYKVSLPQQRCVRCTLGDLVATCEREKLQPPSIVVIGPGAHEGAKFNWFENRPLFGKRIMVTRNAEGNVDLACSIAERGGEAVCVNTMHIRTLTKDLRFLQALGQIAEYDWVVFTSVNGVRTFFESLQSLKMDTRLLGSCKVAAVGSVTAEALSLYGILADFIPSVFTTAALAREMGEQYNLDHKKVLLLRSELASHDLPEILEQFGADVDDVPVYTAEEDEIDAAEVTEMFREKCIDWVTFASPYATEIFFENISADVVRESAVLVASIGPVTSKALEEAGVQVAAEAQVHTLSGMLDAIEAFDG